MKIQENFPLAPFTTFKIGGPAKFYGVAENEDDIKQALAFAEEKGVGVFVLGGGSNMLVSDKGINALVIHLENKGIEVVQENSSDVVLNIASGEVWDEVVAFAVMNGWWGIENLSHIPGRMGAFAVQNVGAYGQEASQVVESVMAFDITEGYVKEIKNIDCNFAYRSSIFNNEQKGKHVILETIIRLSKIPKPNLSYKDLAARFPNGAPSLNDIRSAIIEIRNNKFPFPTEARNGNAGSFFKNTVMTEDQFAVLEQNMLKAFGSSAVESLQAKKILGPDGSIKVPTAYLLDLCGLKGFAMENVGINPSQPLVLLNTTGNATAHEVLTLIKVIRQTVHEKLGLRIAIEPELVGFSEQELAEIDV